MTNPRAEYVYREARRNPSVSWGLIWRSLGGGMMVGYGAHARYLAASHALYYDLPWPVLEGE